MAELQQLETWCSDLLHKMDAANRRRLTIDLAKRLRTTNTGRIKAQTGPEGEAWPKRKPQGEGLGNLARAAALRKKAKRPMFEKLRRAKWLKAKGSADAATVQFAGRAARIAAVHHGGLSDEVKPGGPKYRYPARPLLGISAADADMLRDAILQHLHS